MERGSESGSNNGVPRVWSVRIFGVDITVLDNGASLQHRPHQPMALQVHSLTITELPLIDFLGVEDTNSMHHQQPAVAAVPSPSPPHQPAVSPPPPQHAPIIHPNQPNSDADNSITHAANLEMQVEASLQEAFGGNVDPGMVDVLVELVEAMLEALEGSVDQDLLDVDMSIEIEEIMDSFGPQQHPGLSEEVIMSHLGTCTFQTSSEDKESCCICLNEFSTGDELGKINCDHKFHFTCIGEWLKYNNICPICRALALSVN